jgi:hypothetical protein
MPISLNITVRELKSIERLMTEHGSEWNGWSTERQLHKDLRKVLTQAFVSMADSSSYGQREYDSVVEYKAKDAA